MPERALQTASQPVTLRQLLQPIAIAALPVISSGCVEAVLDDDCIDTIERTFSVAEPAEPSLQFDIERCRVDVDACSDLCRATMMANNVFDQLTGCKVSFGGEVTVTVTYEVFTGGSGCSIEDTPVPTFLSLDHSFGIIGGRTCHA